jgi:hypothetical protein
MNVQIPVSSLTWCKNINSETYMSARAGMLLELWNEDNNTLIERRWNRNGGVFGDDNHPTGSDKTVTDGTILRLVVYNLSRNKLPMQVIVFNSDTSTPPNDTNKPSTFPKGMVNGNGAVSGPSAIPLHKAIVGGEKVEMRFVLSATTHNWWKINCNCTFLSGDGFTATNPNNGINYGADFFNLDYYGGNIRWNNPDISPDNQNFFANTPTWATESGTASNDWYVSGVVTQDCSMIVNGKLLSTWNNAGDGITTLLNHPIEAWNLNNDGMWALKVLKKDVNGNPIWFEPRGRDLFLQFSLAAGITAEMKNCLMGQDVGMAFQTNYLTPTGYIKDGNVFKKTGVPSAPVPSTSSIILGNVISGIADQAGTIRVYQQNSSVIVANVLTSGANNAWTWTPSGIGVYHFKNDNANGLSPYSSLVLVSQSSSGEFDYTVTQIDNDCGKNVQYGIQMLPGQAIQWQDSNVFLNKPDGSPRFYLRNADTLTEVSEPYLIPVI